MNTEILLNVTPSETRMGLVENGVLQEVYIERSNRRGIVGNIYKGKVVRVLPGMQAAFVEVGLDRAAFIHAADIQGPIKDSEAARRQPDAITSLLHEGQSLVVQVTKDPIGTKGARLTTHLSIPSRYLVFMPETQHVGISQRIEDEAERERLRNLVQACMAAEGLSEQCGFILRTAADGAGEDEILSDTRYLQRVWNKVKERMKSVAAPGIIYEELPLHLRTFRDFIRPEVDKVLIDSRENYQNAQEFAASFVPEVLEKLEYYPGERPIFDLYSVEDEIQAA